MAHLAMISPALVSHLAVHLATAEVLMRRGHRVTLIAPPRLAQVVSGMPAHLRPERLPDLLPLDGPPMAPPQGMRALLAHVAAETAAHCRQTPDLLARIGADLVIADQMEPGGSLAAEAAGLPRATLGAALPVNREPGLPPAFVGWAYATGARAEKNYAGAWRVTDWLMAAQGRALAQGCRDHGLASRDRLSDWVSPLCDVVQGVGALDFPRLAPGPGFRRVGAIRRPEPPAPLLDTGGRMAVFASVGTLQPGKAGLLRRIAAAAADLDLCLVLAHCGALTQAEAQRLPGRPIVADYFAQRGVLAQCAAAIIHGGFNTVLDAAAHRVPMVVLPLAYEQPGIAARVARAGAGVVLPRWGRGRAALRHALEQVIRDPGFRCALDPAASQLAAAGGADGAADLIERLLPAALSAA
ncbi:glycosyltransferase [Halodurantibacterium flavum]|uniref:Glycosyltransferase n=1 Tax=Halodurantibacterium flavum TaxID=1382802 RepID=A0ABW4S305_9RHOB